MQQPIGSYTTRCVSGCSASRYVKENLKLKMPVDKYLRHIKERRLVLLEPMSIFAVSVDTIPTILSARTDVKPSVIGLARITGVRRRKPGAAKQGSRVKEGQKTCKKRCLTRGTPLHLSPESGLQLLYVFALHLFLGGGRF